MATLAEASLSELERETLDRFVALLEQQVGDDLVSVWLYGSRARGERTGLESDVDVMVLTRGDAARGYDRARRAMDEAAEVAGTSHIFFSVQVRDLDWLAERRAVEAFFINEVDRDRIVLAGDEQGGERPPLRPCTSVRPRTREMLDQADEWLRDARLVVDGGGRSGAISISYYAMFYAARAALSERDLVVRSHNGMWHLFRQTYVEGGDFDPQLARAAAATQEPREDADYRAKRFSEEQVRETLELAERFVAAVRELIEG
jgi:uncharacterized protein (UPF0332 family)/predicted nucleotidyltransferase